MFPARYLGTLGVAVCAALVVFAPAIVAAQSIGPLTLTTAVTRALAANPKLTAAERDVGIATGRRLQAGAYPNPEASFELDRAFGSGSHRGLRSAETTLQLSQLIELGGKREARVAAGTAELDAARWQRVSVRLEVLSETAVAFFNVLGAQRRAHIFDTQIEALDKLTPLLQRRIEAGASSPAEISRAQVAADLVRAERERTMTALGIARRELAALMGRDSPDFTFALGDLYAIRSLPGFQTVLRGLERNPQLVRWSAVRAQRSAELLTARLKPVPDLRVAAGWRHFNESNEDAVRLSVSVPLPVWDQNLGGIHEARESLGKTGAERAAAKAALVLLLGRAHETASGSLREIDILRRSALPKIRSAVSAVDEGYGQGRFTLLDLLDVQATASQAALREVEALVSYHTALATIEGLTGSGVTLARGQLK